MYGIILGVIQSFLNALGMIFTKKVVENKKVGNNLQTLFNRVYHFIIILLLFSFGILDYNFTNSGFSTNDFILLLVATTGLYITYPLRRIAYANEKVSVLQPYAMLFQVFPVIIGFIFISSERANLITFLTAILASFIVIIPNVDWKNFKMNKYSFMVLMSSIIKSAQVFATIYFLTKINPSTFYFMETILVIFISFSLMTLKNEFKEFKLLTKSYTKLLIKTNSIVVVSILLSLTMYSSLGVVLTSLLSLLYLVFVYILGYFILGERPSKKDVIITLLVSVFIIIGVIAKN